MNYDSLIKPELNATREIKRTDWNTLTLFHAIQANGMEEKEKKNTKQYLGFIASILDDIFFRNVLPI